MQRIDSVMDASDTPPYPVDVKFEWDSQKNDINSKKRGVSFEDAVRVFDAEDDPLELSDDLHSDFEERFITIGPIQSGLVLVGNARRTTPLPPPYGARTMMDAIPGLNGNA